MSSMNADGKGEFGARGGEVPPLDDADPATSSPALAATALDASGASSQPPPAKVVGEDEGPDPLVGKVLSGLYKVEKRLGEGGMGAVYVALHVHLNKEFAVKVLSERIAQNKEAIERLRQEAVAASSIEHDGIVQVVNFDATDDGSVFIVMELLRGQSLGDLVEQGTVPLERALPLVVQIARALHAAHEKGIVHRDLKPENVFLVERRGAEMAKVLDFGISKVKSAEAEEVRMTKTGQLVGTPLYMSPEQAKGETDVDRRADIYALGVILYELLTGSPPFEGGNYFQLLWKHGNEEPEPPSKRNAAIPAKVEEVILTALAKDRSDRYQTMEELEQALVEAAPWLDVPHGHTPSFTSMPPGRASAPTLPPDRRLPMALAAVAAAAVVVALYFGLRGPQQTAETRTPPAPTPHESPRATPDAAAEATPDAALADAGARVPRGVDTPDTVAMEVRSTPPGAAVYLGDERLGTTPFSAQLPMDGPLRLRFSLRGHAPARVLVQPEEGGVVETRLRRRSGGSEGLPIKTTF